MSSHGEPESSFLPLGQARPCYCQHCTRNAAPAPTQAAGQPVCHPPALAHPSAAADLLNGYTGPEGLSSQWLPPPADIAWPAPAQRQSSPTYERPQGWAQPAQLVAPQVSSSASSRGGIQQQDPSARAHASLQAERRAYAQAPAPSGLPIVEGTQVVVVPGEEGTYLIIHRVRF